MMHYRLPSPSDKGRTLEAGTLLRSLLGLVAPRSLLPSPLGGGPRHGQPYTVADVVEAQSIDRKRPAGAKQPFWEPEGFLLLVRPHKGRPVSDIIAMVCLSQNPPISLVAARHRHFHVQVVEGPPVHVPQLALGLGRVLLLDRDSLPRAEAQHNLPGLEAQEPAADAFQLDLERIAERFIHGHHREEKGLVAEEDAHLRHKVRLGPVTGNVHGHVELRRREEGVDAVELAVEIKLDAWMDVKGCMFVEDVTETLRGKFAINISGIEGMGK